MQLWWCAVLEFQTYNSVFPSISTRPIPLTRFLHFHFHQYVYECVKTSVYILTEVTHLLHNFFSQQTPSFQANGKIVSYEVTWEKIEDGSKPQSISFSSVYSSTRIFIDNHSYRISIMAKNNVNFSLPSVLIISRATDNSRSTFSYNYMIRVLFLPVLSEVIIYHLEQQINLIS